MDSKRLIENEDLKKVEEVKSEGSKNKISAEDINTDTNINTNRISNENNNVQPDNANNAQADDSDEIVDPIVPNSAEELTEREKYSKTALVKEMMGVNTISSVFTVGINDDMDLKTELEKEENAYYKLFFTDNRLKRLAFMDYVANQAPNEPFDLTDPVTVGPDCQGNEISGYNTLNKSAANRYIKGVKETADYLDKLFKEYGEANGGIKEKGLRVLQAASSNKLRRISEGYPLSRLRFKTPLADCVESIDACIDFSLVDGKLQKKIDKWNGTFPVYDYLIASDEMLNTLKEYYSRREQNGDKLSLNEEESHREYLYYLVINAIRPFQKMMAAVEDPALHQQLNQAGIFSGGNEPFHIHPVSSRGLRSTAASLEAYKKGLENGWAIDDIAVLAAFRNVIEVYEMSSLGNANDKYSTYEKYDEPTFASPQIKDYAKRLRDCYDKITAKPILNGIERAQALREMKSLIKEGKKKGYFKDSNNSDMKQHRYFEHVYLQATTRNPLIENETEKEKMPSTYSRLYLGNNRKLDIISILINSRRTDSWWSSESAIHSKLRSSVDNLRNMMNRGLEFHTPKEREELLSLNEAKRSLELDKKYLENALEGKSEDPTVTLNASQKAKDKKQLSENILEGESKNPTESKVILSASQREEYEKQLELVDKQLAEIETNKAKYNKTMSAFMENAYQLLNALDEVNYYTASYLSKRNSTSSIGGKRRKEGATLMHEYVIEEKRNLLEQAKEKGLKVSNVDELRKKLTEEHRTYVVNELIRMEKFKKGDRATRLTIKSHIADLLVYRYIKEHGLEDKPIVQGRGFESLKKKLLKDKDFQKLTDRLIDNLKTGRGIFNAIDSDNNIFAKLPKFTKRMAAIEKQMKSIKTETVKPVAKEETLAPNPNAEKKANFKPIM